MAGPCIAAASVASSTRCNPAPSLSSSPAKTIRTIGDDITVEGVGYEPEGRLCIGDRVVDPVKHSTVLDMIRAAMLCNDATLERTGQEWTPEGDPTESALIVLAHKAGFEPASENERSPRIDALPFASERRYMATLNKDSDGSTCELTLPRAASVPVVIGRERRKSETSADQRRGGSITVNMDWLHRGGQRQPVVWRAAPPD